MKVRLITDCYGGMDGVQFPAEVEAEEGSEGFCRVQESELARIGCDMDIITDPDDPVWPFGPGEWEYAE